MLRYLIKNMNKKFAQALPKNTMIEKGNLRMINA